MKPVNFSEANVVLGANQPDYQPLPAHKANKADDPAETVTSCWELNDMELELLRRMKVIWLQQLTFGHRLQPQLPSVGKPIGPTNDQSS